MAIVQNTITGRTRRSVGNVTFTTWKGLNVMKSKPISVANPKTQGQVNQRSALALLVHFYRQISGIVSVGFMQQAVHKSAYNAFVGTNLKNGFIDGDSPDFDISDDLFQVAKGTLTPAPITDIARDNAAHTVTITWDPTATGDQLDTDAAYAVLMIDNENREFVTKKTKIRSDGSVTVGFDATTDNATPIASYLFFYQPSTRKVSDSQFGSDR